MDGVFPEAVAEEFRDRVTTRWRVRRSVERRQADDEPWAEVVFGRRLSFPLEEHFLWGSTNASNSARGQIPISPKARTGATTEVLSVFDGGTIGPAMILEYRIDRADHLVSVNVDWETFAIDNDALDLATPSSDGPIWGYFAGDEVRFLWQALVQRVRAEQRPIRLPFRCDAPAARRWFTITVSAEPQDVVHFCSTLVREEPRDPVALLDRRTPRDPAAPPLRSCAWCGRYFDGSEWVPVESLLRDRAVLAAEVIPAVTHGICPACARLMGGDQVSGPDVLLPTGEGPLSRSAEGPTPCES